MTLTQTSSAPEAAGVHAAGSKTGDQRRRAPNKHWIDVNAIFQVEALLAGKPERQHPCGVRGVTDDIFRRGGGERLNEAKKFHRQNKHRADQRF